MDHQETTGSSEEINAKPIDDRLKGMTVIGKIDLSRIMNERRGPGGRGPRPVTPYVPSEEKDANSSEKDDYGMADAMTNEFGRSFSKMSYYNDDLDMDQQSEEYWNNL